MPTALSARVLVRGGGATPQLLPLHATPQLLPLGAPAVFMRHSEMNC